MGRGAMRDQAHEGQGTAPLCARCAPSHAPAAPDRRRNPVTTGSSSSSTTNTSSKGVCQAQYAVRSQAGATRRDPPPARSCLPTHHVTW